MTAPDPGRVLRRALLAWGLGHLAIGRRGVGLRPAGGRARGGPAPRLADDRPRRHERLPRPVPGRHRLHRRLGLAGGRRLSIRALRCMAARPPTPERSPAAAIGWLSLPLLRVGHRVLAHRRPRRHPRSGARPLRHRLEPTAGSTRLAGRRPGGGRGRGSAPRQRPRSIPGRARPGRRAGPTGGRPPSPRRSTTSGASRASCGSSPGASWCRWRTSGSSPSSSGRPGGAAGRRRHRRRALGAGGRRRRFLRPPLSAIGTLSQPLTTVLSGFMVPP